MGKGLMGKKSERQIIEKKDEVEKKEKDLEKIDEILGDLPKDGKTTPEQNKPVADKIEDMIKDKLNDPSIDINNITEQDLKDKGVPQEKIDEIMKLKDIHDKVI